MKRILLAVCASLATAFAFASASSTEVPTLKALYKQHEWLKLRELTQSMDAPDFYRGAVAAAFDDFPRAEKALTSAIASAPKSEMASDARLLLVQLYMRAGNYQASLDAMDEASKYTPDDEGLKNARALYASLSRYPEQRVAARGFSSVRYRMKDGNMFVPLEIDGKPGSYLVDSGANVSLISESEVKRLGLTIDESGGATIGDSSGARFGFRITVADRLELGKLRLEHVLFIVLRDDQQPFVELAEGERAILGFPVFKAFETVRWTKEGAFEIGFASGGEAPGKPNLFFEGQQMFAEGESMGKTINLFVDTGAVHTRLLPRFARDFPDFVASFGKKDSQKVTGVSASVEVESVTLPEVKLGVRGSEVKLSPVTLLTKDTVSDLARCHAWIGMDALSQPGMVALDFKAMTFALGK
jgi:predicted aspartyl protease